MFSPIIDRELRVALRKRPLHRARLWAAAIGAGLCFVFLLNGVFAGTRMWGRTLHQYLFYAGLYAALIVPTRACVRLISEERQGNSMELLALTGIRPTQYLFGKAVGGLLVASCELLALVPFFALPFLAGGVSLEVFLATIVCLPTLLFLSVAIALLGSSLCSDDGVALITAIAITCVLCLASPAPYALGKTLTGAPPFSAAWLGLSPGYAGLLVATNFAYGRVYEFWRAAAITWLWTGLAFFVASLVLRRHWKSSVEPKASSWRVWGERWLRGTDQRRLHLRARLLDKNPFQWLAQRERRPVMIAWLSLIGISVLWLLGWMTWSRAWLSIVNFIFMATILLVLERTVASHAVARRMGEDRRESHLELLLTTPLTPNEIVDGQLRAAREQFRSLRFVVFAMFLLMAGSGLLLKKWHGLDIAVYAVIWLLLFFWCVRKLDHRLILVMWLALNTGRPTFAILRSQGKLSPWYWIWMFWNLRRVASLAKFGGASYQFPTGSGTEVFIVGIIGTFVLMNLAKGANETGELQSRMLENMRSIAQTPVPDPEDPRFKQWQDVKQLFPAQKI